MEQWTAEILAGIAALVFVTAALWRVMVKTLIDLLTEVRDARRENIKLHQQNIQLVRLIQRDRAQWAKEKADMQAQIDKLVGYINRLVPHLRTIWKQNQEQAEKIETLLAVNSAYREQLRQLPKKPNNHLGD